MKIRIGGNPKTLNFVITEDVPRQLTIDEQVSIYDFGKIMMNLFELDGHAELLIQLDKQEV